MKSCSNIPVELILATTDPKLYDAQNKKWLWSGQMYWVVECLDNQQTTVSDSVVPNIDPDKYVKLSENPTVWDYCNSSHCSDNSDSMHVVFTFNPNSTNPQDYLQYVINISCQITDSPRHDIKDADGNNIYITITNVEKTSNLSYAEIWISREERTGLAASAPDIIQPKSKTDMWIIIVIIAIVLLFILVGMMFVGRPKEYSTGSSTGSSTVPIGNIG